MIESTNLTKMYSILDEYNRLPIAFKDQLDHIYEIWSQRHPNANKKVEKLTYFKPIDQKKISAFLFYRHHKARDALSLLNKYVDPEDLICYNEYNKWIRFHKIITAGSHVILFEGKRKGIGDDLVIKWYQSDSKNTSYEIDIYEKLRNLGARVPVFFTGFYFWETPVLVMEKLESVGKNDDPWEMGIQVLNQLKIVHRICIHNDIKPGNIMKRGSTYFLIDYGGVTTERLEWGFKRKVWSPKWTCQPIHGHNQITSPIHDFIELGFTMQSIEDERTNTKTKRGHWHGKMKRYMQAVESFNPKNIKLQDYDYLISILK